MFSGEKNLSEEQVTQVTSDKQFEWILNLSTIQQKSTPST
jgi:hypothetical protein